MEGFFTQTNENSNEKKFDNLIGKVMRKNVFTIMMVAIAMSISSTVFAQGNPNARQNGQRFARQDAPFNQLKLTDAQKEKISKMRKEFAVKDSVEFAKIQTVRTTMMNNHRNALESVLTPEQKEQLKNSGISDSSNGRGRTGAFAPGAGFQRGPGMNVAPAKGRQGRGGVGVGRGSLGAGRGQMTQGRGELAQGRGEIKQGRGMNENARKGFANFKPRRVKQGIFKKNAAKRFSKVSNERVRMPLVNPETRIDNQVEAMTKRLDLSADQAKKIRAIKTKYAKKEIKNFKREQKKWKKFNAPMEEIKSVLNKEQLEKLGAREIESPYSFEDLKPTIQDINFNTQIILFG